MSSISVKISNVWNSRCFLPAVLVFSCLMTLLDLSFIGMFILVFVCAVLLVFCDDLLAIMSPVYSILLMSSAFYRDYSALTAYMWYAIVPVAAALLFHILYYRRGFKRSYCCYPLLAVSIALLLGGVGVISRADYFKPISLYYCIGLGFFMLLINALAASRLQNERDYGRKGRVAEILYFAGLFAAVIVCAYYLHNWQAFLKKGSLLYFKQRNYISSVILLAMPMCAFSVKKSDLHLIGLFFMYFCMIMSGSRSGMLFGTVTLVLTLAYIYCTKRGSRRLYNRLMLAAILPAIAAAFILVPYVLGSRSANGESAKSDNTRIALYTQGAEDFIENPVFGVGMGNLKNSELFTTRVSGSIIFYHNLFVQIFAALGLCGAFAYGWQGFRRLRLLWLNRRSDFLLYALSYFAIIMMTMVNPGLFCPFPEAAATVVMFAVVEKEGIQISSKAAK